MKIRICDKYNEYREIQSIKYTQFNDKDTIIDYLKESDERIYTVRFKGWLSLQEIINNLMYLLGE